MNVNDADILLERAERLLAVLEQQRAAFEDLKEALGQARLVAEAVRVERDLLRQRKAT